MYCRFIGVKIYAQGCNQIIMHFEVPLSTCLEEFGWTPQCGFLRTRAAERNQICMHFGVRISTSLEEFGGLLGTRVAECNLRFMHFEVPLSTSLVEIGCTPQCGFFRTFAAECNQIVMHRRWASILVRSNAKTERPPILIGGFRGQRTKHAIS